MNKKPALLGIAVALCSLALSGTILSTPASAFTAKSGTKLKEVYQKAIVWGISTCYSDTYMKKTYTKPKNGESYPLFELFTTAGENTSKLLYPNVTSQNKGKTKNMGPYASCEQLFANTQYNNTGAINKYFSVNPGGVKLGDLPSIGYNISSADQYERCIQYSYRDGSSTNGAANTKTAKVCFYVDGNNNNSKVTGVVGGNYTAQCAESGIVLDGTSYCKRYEDSDKIAAVLTSPSSSDSNAQYQLALGFNNAIVHKQSSTPFTWGNVVSYAQELWSQQQGYTGSGLSQTNAEEDFSQKVTYTKASDAQAKAIKYFTNNAYTEKKTFTNADKLTLYQNYINQMLEAEDNGVTYDASSCKSGTTEAKIEEVKEELKKTTGYLYHKSTKTWCVLNVPDDKLSYTFVGLDGKNLKKMTFKDIILEMQKKKYDTYKTPQVATEEATKETDDGDTISCYDAVPSLGWILCPTTQAIGNVVQGLYDFIATSFLEVDTTILKSSGSGNYLYQAWGTFRDYANIVFIILLALVILSQLTGFGISNYSIKKTLPRLIVMVILVNVSFIICQLAVDLSNILGSSLETTFSELAEQVKVGDSVTTLGPSVGQMVAAAMGAGATTIGGIAIVAATWRYWLIPFLVFLLGCIIGVFFFAIILGVRQAGIIILVALSPVAIVCYSLPNTKKIFDKWFKLFSSLLFVYPIAGLLMGGGLWASRLLFAAGADVKSENGIGGFFYAMVALLMQVVPFFFVPTLVKSSLAAAGNLGAKISGVGDKLGGAAKGGIRSSGAYKDAQQRMAGAQARSKLNPWYKRDNKFTRLPGVRSIAKARGAVAGVGEKFRSLDNPVSQMANNSHNRKMNRLNTAALAADLGNRDRSSHFDDRQMQEMMSDHETRMKNDGSYNNGEAVDGELQTAITALNQNPTDLDARARFLVAAKKQMTSSGGRKSFHQSMLAAVDANGGIVSNGVRWAAGAAMDEFGDKLKGTSLNAFKDVQEMSSGKFEASGLKKEQDEEGNDIWVNHRSPNDIKSMLQDVGESSIGKLDKHELGRYANMIEKGEITGEDRSRIISAARAARNNENINIEPDRDKAIDKIAALDYTSPATGNNNNDSVDAVDSTTIRAMANSGQAELDRLVYNAENGNTKDQELNRITNVAEATLKAAQHGKANITQKQADKLNRILAVSGRRAVPYSLHVDHGNSNNNPTPPPSGYHDTGTGSGIVVPN